MRDYLKKKLGVPENWDKYDYQTLRYSFEDIEEILQTLKDEQLLLDNVSQQREYFYKVCDELEKLTKQLITPSIKSLVVDKVLEDICG